MRKRTKKDHIYTT